MNWCLYFSSSKAASHSASTRTYNYEVAVTRSIVLQQKCHAPRKSESMLEHRASTFLLPRHTVKQPWTSSSAQAPPSSPTVALTVICKTSLVLHQEWHLDLRSTVCKVLDTSWRQYCRQSLFHAIFQGSRVLCSLTNSIVMLPPHRQRRFSWKSGMFYWPGTTVTTTDADFSRRTQDADLVFGQSPDAAHCGAFQRANVPTVYSVHLR